MNGIRSEDISHWDKKNKDGEYILKRGQDGKTKDPNDCRSYGYTK